MPAELTTLFIPLGPCQTPINFCLLPQTDLGTTVLVPSLDQDDDYFVDNLKKWCIGALKFNHESRAFEGFLHDMHTTYP